MHYNSENVEERHSANREILMMLANTKGNNRVKIFALSLIFAFIFSLIKKQNKKIIIGITGTAMNSNHTNEINLLNKNN